MLHDVDETLRRLLLSELRKTPGCAVYYPEQISFDPPALAESVQDGEAHVNLYLHDVRENLMLRDESFRRVGKPEDGILGRRRAVVRLDISYLITVYARDDARTEHRLMAEVLGALMRHLSVPMPFLSGILEGRQANDLLLAVAQPDHPSYADPSGLWNALGGKLRPALSLMVTGPFDPFETKWTKVVREVVVGMVPGTEAVNGASPPGRIANSVTSVSAAGIVLDQRTETPLPLAHVSVVGGGDGETAQTDSRGFFHLTNLGAGAKTLAISCRGYKNAQCAVQVPPPNRSDLLAPVVIGLEKQTDADWAQNEAVREARGIVAGNGQDAQTLSGRLFFDTGTPAARVMVRCGAERVRTNDQGFYAFFGVPLDQQEIIAEMPGHGDIVIKANQAEGK